MNKKTPRRQMPPDDYNLHSDEATSAVISSTECTGMVPALPETDEEAESYTQLYDIPQPKPAHPPSPRK